MKFGRNQRRSQPIVRVARLAGPELVVLLHSRAPHTNFQRKQLSVILVRFRPPEG
jgi:hypothetical protein